MTHDNRGELSSRSKIYGDSQDEISLVDLWLILQKRIRLMAATFAIVMCLAVVYLLVAKPVYLSRAVIAVGYLPDLANLRSEKPKWAEVPNLLVKRLQEEYKVKDTDGEQIELPALSSVIHDKKNGDEVVELSAKAYSAEVARTFLDSVVSRIITEHKARYDGAYKELELLMESRKQIIDDIDAQTSKLQAVVDGLNSDDLKDASPLYSRLSLLSQQKLDFLNQYDELRRKINSKYEPTRTLREPTLPTRKHKPKAALVIAAAFVIAIFLAIFSAFIMEFFDNVRKQAQRNRG